MVDDCTVSIRVNPGPVHKKTRYKKKIYSKYKNAINLNKKKTAHLVEHRRSLWLAYILKIAKMSQSEKIKLIFNLLITYP